MKQRSTSIATLLAITCVMLVTGCGKTQPQASAAAETPAARAPAPAPARSRFSHAMGAPAEARRLTNTINSRQAAAMAELDRP